MRPLCSWMAREAPYTLASYSSQWRMTSPCVKQNNMYCVQRYAVLLLLRVAKRVCKDRQLAAIFVDKLRAASLRVSLPPSTPSALTRCPSAAAGRYHRSPHLPMTICVQTANRFRGLSFRPDIPGDYHVTFSSKGSDMACRSLGYASCSTQRIRPDQACKCV